MSIPRTIQDNIQRVIDDIERFYVNLQVGDTDVDPTNPVPSREVPGATATYASDWGDSTADEASHVVKASAGVLYGFSGHSSTAQYIQIHDAATLPADTAVPEIVIYVEAGANFAWDSGKFGKYFGTGIVITNSSTRPLKTIGAADCWFNVSFK